MFTLEFATYRGAVANLSASSINVPTTDGRRGILSNHMAVIMPLEIGTVEVRNENNETTYYAISKGVLYFKNNHCSIVANTVEAASEIDIERAKLAESKSLEKIEQAASIGDIVELEHARIGLAKAKTRIATAQYK